MYRDRDVDARQPLPWNELALTQDLALDTLLGAIEGGDETIREVTRRALLCACANDLETVHYRQAIVRDALDNPVALRELYALSVEAVEAKRRHYFGTWGRYPSSVLYGALAEMRVYVDLLRRLRDRARAVASHFTSEGFATLFAMLERELDDEYLTRIEGHLADLRFRGGTLISAALGPDNAGRDYLLHQPPQRQRRWLMLLFAKGPPAYTFHLAARDEAGARALSELRDSGIRAVSAALADSAHHVDRFFQTLRTELAFYVGCLNLHEQLTALGAPTCFPRSVPAGERSLRSQGLYDPCLALQMQHRVVGNSVDATGKSLIIVTGANRGGKSVFLRSLGVAQLMMQSGMFVGAESFEGAVCTSLVTHYQREEDATLTSGKFDEELKRMSEIVDHLAPNALLLFNESFAATNEREGSEIARQVVLALLEKGMRVCFVTHLHAFARGFFDRTADQTLFLRAERLADGRRTFRLIEGEPLATSYGRDLYARIFAGSA